MRFTEVCRPATRLATVMVSTAMSASAGGQPVPQFIRRSSPKATISTRSRIANAAALTATAMKLVAGVGAPSYASGVHMWKGTALTLNSRPTKVSTKAIRMGATGTTLPG